MFIKGCHWWIFFTLRQNSSTSPKLTASFATWGWSVAQYSIPLSCHTLHLQNLLPLFPIFCLLIFWYRDQNVMKQKTICQKKNVQASFFLSLAVVILQITEFSLCKNFCHHWWVSFFRLANYMYENLLLLYYAYTPQFYSVHRIWIFMDNFLTVEYI